VTQQLQAHLLLDEPDLGGALVVLGEAVLQQPLAHERLGRPPVRHHVGLRPGPDVRHDGRCIAGDARRVEAHVCERAGRVDAQGAPAVGGLGHGGEAGVGPVDVQQVLTLGVEHHRLRVGQVHPQQRPPRVCLEEHVQQEERVARLGGDAADAGDRHVPAAAPVDEVEVGVDGLAGLV
jgi:hypothetical protein